MFLIIWLAVMAALALIILGVKAPSVLAAVMTAGIILGVATACGPTEGTVVSKTHFPDLSYWSMDPVYTSVCSGNPSVCRSQFTGMSQTWHYVPECWRLRVRTPKDKLRNKCVDQSVYDGMQPGQYWRDAK